MSVEAANRRLNQFIKKNSGLYSDDILSYTERAAIEDLKKQLEATEKTEETCDKDECPSKCSGCSCK